jgi:8-oxo-dGTP diphosphatase
VATLIPYAIRRRRRTTVPPVPPAPAQPRGPVVVGVVQKEKDVILVCRKRAEKTLLWQFPAGVMHPTRPAAESIVKEVRAETGIICRAVRELGRRVHPDTGTSLVYFHCSYVSGELVNGDPDENSDVRWMSASAVGDHITSDMFPPVADLLRTISA